MSAALGAGVVVSGDLAGMLTGALAVSMGRELALGAAGLGIAIAVTRAAASATAFNVGRMTDRFGTVTSLRATAIVAAVACGGIALFATNWTRLIIGLAIAGCSMAMAQASSNRLISTAVPIERQGIAFGIKQSAPPIASLLAGFSVPLVAVTLGWRWAFVFAALLSVAMLPAIGRRPANGARAPRRTTEASRPSARRQPARVALGVAFAFGSAAAAVLPAFYVDAAVTAGSSVTAAGTLLAVASALTICTRIILGVIADRLVSGHFRLCAGFLGVGGVGFVLLGSGRPALMTAGMLIASPTVWGFNGLFWYGVMQIGRDAPGTMTGVLSPGGHLGGSVGPLLFGLLAASIGYDWTWVVWTTFAMIAAVSMLLASHSIERWRRAQRSN